MEPYSTGTSSENKNNNPEGHRAGDHDRGTEHDAASEGGGAEQPRAPMSGAVVAVPVTPGDRVEAGDTLMVIEAMKMEHAIVAQAAATVSEVLFAVGEQVDEGETLVLLEVE